MKILLIGKTGQLAGDIIKNAGSTYEVYAPERNILDIGYPEAIRDVFLAYKPEVVINTAAFHNVPLCEGEHEMAFKINCIAVRDLAKYCKKLGAVFVTFSTDYVFDGAKKTPYIESDKPAPLQIYGISKLAGEFAATSVWPEKTVIIRTCGLYGISGAQSKGGNFVDKRLQDAKTHSLLEISSDQIVSPTYTEDLSKAVLQLLERRGIEPGIYHLVNEGECTWHEFTKAIFDIMGLKNIQVKPVDREGLSGKMRRPLYSVLANNRAKALGVVLPHWRDALKGYLEAKYMRRDGSA